MKKLTWYLKLLHKPENVVWNGEVSAVTGAAPFSADTSPCVKHRLVKACQHGAATDTSGNRSAQGILGLYIKPHTTHRVYNPSQNTVREAQASQLGAATDAAGNRSAQGILGLYIKPHTTHRVHNPSQHRSWSTGLSAWCSNRYCWEWRPRIRCRTARVCRAWRSCRCWPAITKSGTDHTQFNCHELCRRPKQETECHTMWRKCMYSGFETCFGPSTKVRGSDIKTQLKSRFGLQAILKR